jgi:hypothetical protein
VHWGLLAIDEKTHKRIICIDGNYVEFSLLL